MSRPGRTGDDARSGADRHRAHGAIDGALAEHARTDVDHGGLAGGDTVERVLRRHHELTAGDDRHGRHGVGVRADLHLACERRFGVGRRLSGLFATERPRAAASARTSALLGVAPSGNIAWASCSVVSTPST